MKKVTAIILVCVILMGIAICLCGCSLESQADKVSRNLSLEADNFNNVRQITVMNCITGDILFQMTGKMSITTDTADHKLDVIVEGDNGEYYKHFIGLSDNVTYVIEDIGGENVSNYHYTLNFNPKMWIPWNIETID